MEKIVQHRKNLSPYYPKEYALRELTQLNSFTGLKIIQNFSDIEQNQITDRKKFQKQANKKNYFTKHLLNQRQKHLKKKEKTGK